MSYFWQQIIRNHHVLCWPTRNTTIIQVYKHRLQVVRLRDWERFMIGSRVVLTVMFSAITCWWLLQARNNGGDSVSNHQPHDCLLNGLFRCRSKKTWKLRVTCLCAGNSPGTCEFPAQMAGNGLQRGKCFHLMTSSWKTKCDREMDMYFSSA